MVHATIVAVIVAAGIVLTALPSTAADISITGCGQTVPSARRGVLQTDLVCPVGPPGTGAVQLERNATLEMNGHRITGGFAGVAGTLGGRGPALYRVLGPGEITGAEIGIDAKPTSEIGSLVVRDVSIHDNARVGAQASKRLTATNVSADGNDFGLIAGLLIAAEVSASGNIRKGFMQAGIGISAGRVRGRDIAVNANEHLGVVAHNGVSVSRLTATGNGDFGFRLCARDVVASLTDSILTGNNGLAKGGDIHATFRPHLNGTSCGRSFACSFGSPTLGVCSND
jgi:hypothetical protein